MPHPEPVFVQPFVQPVCFGSPSNHRSLHNEPRPRNGGLAILSGFSLGWVIVWWLLDTRFMGGDFLCYGLLLAVAVSFFDDKYSLSAWLRFLIQTCAALLLMVGGFSMFALEVPGIGNIALGWFGVPFSILFVVWMMNLYKFMDGMDGLAGGMGAFGFGFFSILGWVAGETFFSATALVIAVANLGFLTQNFPAPTARIFMGDVGSVPMGFLAASLSLWGVRDGIFELWAPVLIFSPFIFDATITVLKRGVSGEKVWQAHCSHYYQRLVQCGWGHRKTVLSEYALMCGFGGIAIFLHYSGNDSTRATGLTACFFLYVLLARLVDRNTLPPKQDI